MKILITGATGFIGSKLIESLLLKGHSEIRILTRNKQKTLENLEYPVEVFEWNPNTNYIELNALENVDIIFHLAGESVAGSRWTKEKKEKILNSRIKSSKLLLKSISETKTKPKKIISASAIGIYGKGFLADVCKSWEETILNHSIEQLNAYIIRIGIVLGLEGGALQQMLAPFKAGVAGILGNGKQTMSWIHVQDLVNQFIFVMENECKNNIFNGVAPNPVSNFEFTKTLGSVLNRPTIFPLPAFALKIIFGEMSEILLAGQKIFPETIKNEGFQFNYPKLKSALENILEYELKGEKRLVKYQWLDKKKEEVFSFFSNETNLEKITPPYLNFKVLNKTTDTIKEGTLIDYKLSLHGIPLKWKTRINKFEKNIFFIDEQLKGPYKKWIHTHSFFHLKNGTLIKDEIIYKAPLGFLGNLFAGSFIRKDLKNIFNFRKNSIQKLLC